MQLSSVIAMEPTLAQCRDRARSLAPSIVSAWAVARPEVMTWPNLVTALRLAGGMVAFGLALATGSQAWNYVGLAVYWGGDMLDGYIARHYDQETILGAEFDILADRMLICLFYVTYVSANPEKLIVALAFLFEFMVIDHFLSNQFGRWGIRSPNYFHRVDRATWRWLWSQPAKALNTGLVTVLTIAVPWVWPPLLVVAGLVVVRVYFTLRVLALSADARDAARRSPRTGALPSLAM